MKECAENQSVYDWHQKATATLVNDLLELCLERGAKDCAFTNPSARYAELKANAQELGYVK